MSPSSRFAPAALSIGLLILSACSGGGGDGGGDDGDTRTEDASPIDVPLDEPQSEPDYPTLDEAAAQRYRERAEFTHVDPLGSSTSAYGLQNIHYAHTATLEDGSKVTGEGALIAVIDNGFRLTHQELSGKSIIRFLGNTSSLGIDDHGTAVAAIAAGKADGTGMMGVAPDADLHLASWDDPPEANLLRHLAAATDDAARLGAAVQNNSWAWTVEERADTEAENFDASGIEDYAEYIATQQGGAAAEWRALFSAYDDFQETGVIVVANSNDPGLGDASAWAALPELVPELSEAWIAASDAHFTVDSQTDAILEAELLSAPCGTAAPYCLTNSGTLRAPTANSTNSYTTRSGTSFSAPQISGQIALLAQAFPNLTPAEWTARLLATARRDWPGFTNSIAGETRFVAGLTRSYSRLYGHGVPDMKAALSPVGGLSITTGTSVFSGERSSIEDGVAASGPIVGNAVAKTLSSRKLMVVDRLGTDFYIDGSELKPKKRRRGGNGWNSQAQHLLRGAQRFDYAFASAETEAATALALRDTAQTKLFFSHGFANTSADFSFSRLMATGEKNFLQFSGWMDNRIDARAGGFTASRLTMHDGFTSELSFAAGQADGQLFGEDASGPFLSADASSNFSVGFGINIPGGSDWSLSGFAELGSGFTGDDPDALVDYGTLAYAGGGFALNRHHLVKRGDATSLYFGVRPAAIAGEATMRLPVGRDKDGVISYERVGIDLNEADVPLRVGLAYGLRTSNDFDWRFNANVDFEAGNEENAALDLAVALRKEF